MRLVTIRTLDNELKVPLLTAAPLVRPVVAVPNSIAHPVLVNALLPHAAVEVLLRAVFAVELVTKVWTVHDTVTHPGFLTP